MPAERDATPVRAFAAFTPDLHALVDWLVQCSIDAVALESTGVYWVPIFELLEQRGIKPYLVNARHVKTVPGRKSDWNDAQWLQKLHPLGLLQGSFRPDAQMCLLPTLLPHRAQLIEHRAPHILHMQQALKLMNLQLSEGLACQAPLSGIAKALTGTWREEQLFILKQALDLYDYYSTKLSECDAQIQRQLAAMKPRFDCDQPPPALPPVKPGSKSKNRPGYDARPQLGRLIGVDLVAVSGISASIAQSIISEIGTDMSRFPTVKHFCSWLGLAPHNDISGGRVLRSRTLKVVNRATQAFRQAAQSVARSDSAFGAYFRAMRARLGLQQATVATAHKIARVVYHLLKHREGFTAESAPGYERQRRQWELKRLTRRANKLGYTLIPVAASQPAPAA